MDITGIINGLQSGLQTVTKLAPMASILGGGPLVAMAGGLAEIADNTLTRIKEGQLVASERDANVIRAISKELAAQNDALAAAIAKS